jgi:PAS domain S-box
MLKLRYIWTYILLAAIIACCVLAGSYLLRSRLQNGNSYSHVINMAGKQRMRSQRLVKLSTDAFYGKLDKKTFKTELEQWNNTHFALQNAQGQYGVDMPMQDEVITRFANISPLHKELSSQFRHILVSTRVDKTMLADVNYKATQYAQRMDAIISAIEEDAAVYHARVNGSTESTSWLLAGIVLFSILAIIFPQHYRAVRAYEELKARKQEIEKYRMQAEQVKDTQSLMIGGTDAGGWDWDVFTDEVTWTPKMYNLLGYEPSEVKFNYTRFTGIIHPEDRDQVESALQRHLTRHTPFKEEARLRMKDGSYSWFSISGMAMWDADGKAQRMAGSVINVDASVKYLRELEYNEYLLEESGKLAKVGGWEYDITKDLYTWSKTMYEINGMMPGSRITLKERIKRYRPADRRHLADLMNRAITHGEEYDLELMSHQPDGTEVWSRIIGTPVYDEQTGQVVRLRGVYQDITQQKARERELEQTKERLSESNDTKDKLFSIIAHDLRSPINNMKSLIDMKEEDIITQEEFSLYLAQIKQNVHYVSGAMDNMLYWAQSQMEGFRRKPRRVSLGEIADMAINLYDSSLSQKRITVINSADTEHYALVDADHLFIILRNLVNNAMKFTPDGGHIYIDTCITDTEAQVIVKDDGPGMSADVLQTLRSHNTLYTTPGTQGEKGTGLGLNLCYELTEKNNGTLKIHSQLGKGSIFTVTLPLPVNANVHEAQQQHTVL